MTHCWVMDKCQTDGQIATNPNTSTFYDTTHNDTLDTRKLLISEHIISSDA